MRGGNEADGPVSPPVAARSAGQGPASLRRRRRRDTQLPDEPQEIRALEPQGAGGVRAIAAHLVQRHLDEPPLEIADGAVIAERTSGCGERTVGGLWNGIHGRASIATDVP